MNSIIVLFYFVLFIVISSLYKENIKNNKVLTAIFVYLSSSISISIVYFLYLYSEFHTFLPIFIGVNFIISILLLVPLLIIKKTYGKYFYKLLIYNLTQHLIYFFTFLIAISILKLMSDVNYVFQIIALLISEILFVYFLVKVPSHKSFSSLLGTTFIISFMFLSILVYETPSNYESDSNFQNEEFGLYEKIEYSDVKNTVMGNILDIVIKDNLMYILTTDYSDRMGSLEVYDLNTNDYSTICDFEDPSTDYTCPTQTHDIDYAGGLELYNDTIYFYSQNGLYYINDENELTLLVAPDLLIYSHSLLYLENGILFFENNTSVSEVTGTTVTLLEDRESQYIQYSSPFTRSLVLVKNSDVAGYLTVVNGIYYSGFSKDSVEIYSDSIFTGYYDDTYQHFIYIDGIEYLLDYPPYGVVKIEDNVYVLYVSNDALMLFDPLTSETISYIDEDLLRRYQISIIDFKYFVTYLSYSNYQLKEFAGFSGKTIVYNQSRFYSTGYMLLLPVLVFFAYAAMYEAFEYEKYRR